jgi:hypothetical protein
MCAPACIELFVCQGTCAMLTLGAWILTLQGVCIVILPGLTGNKQAACVVAAQVINCTSCCCLCGVL